MPRDGINRGYRSLGQSFRVWGRAEARPSAPLFLFTPPGPYASRNDVHPPTHHAYTWRDILRPNLRRRQSAYLGKYRGALDEIKRVSLAHHSVPWVIFSA